MAGEARHGGVTSGERVTRDGWIYSPVFFEVDRDDPEQAWQTFPTGERGLVGYKLADLVEKHGGWQVPVQARTKSGEIVPLVLSLEPLRERDPETTFLMPGWSATPVDRPLYCTPEGPIAS